MKSSNPALTYLSTFLAVAAFVGMLASQWFGLKADVALLKYRLDNAVGEYRAPAEGK